MLRSEFRTKWKAVYFAVASCWLSVHNVVYFMVAVDEKVAGDTSGT